MKRGNPKILTSADQIINTILSEKDEVDLISFDVFDTLLCRVVGPPEVTKIPAARELAKFLNQKEKDISVYDLYKKRCDIEVAQSEQSRKFGRDGAISISDVFREWVDLYHLTGNVETIISELVKIEIASELKVTRPIEGMVNAVQLAKNLAKKVVWISDMYLAKNHIELLLENHGLGNFFYQGYVSSECGLKKHSGLLFKKVLRDLDISPDRWLHYGDNNGADFFPPKKLGGKSFLFLQKKQNQKSTRLKRLKNAEKRQSKLSGASFWENFNDLVPGNRFTNSAYQLGYHLFGPLISLFIHLTIEQVKKHKIQLVLFPAREGFVFRTVFNTLKQTLLTDSNIPTEYCYLNRKTTYLASLLKLGNREIVRGLSFTQRPTIRIMLNRFSLDPMEFESIATQCGIGLDEIITDKFKNPCLLKFVQHPSTLKLIEKRRKDHSKLLHQYLSQIGFWDAKRVGFVDIGWKGTVQDALTHAFGQSKKWPDFFGMYMAFFKDLPILETERSHYKGLIHQHSDELNLGNSLRRGISLFEIILRPAQATAEELIHQNETGIIMPKFKEIQSRSRTAEIKDQGTVASVQAGIFDFAEVYKGLIDFQEYNASHYIPYLLICLDRFLKLPTKKEAGILTHLHQTADFGTDIVIGGSQKIRLLSLLWDILKGNNQKMGVWPEGFLVKRYGSLMLFFYNLSRLILNRNY